MSINKSKNILIVLFAFFIAGISSNSLAQTIGILCSNSKTKAITVVKTTCPSGTTRLSLSNITSTSSCYTATASNSGAGPTGRVSVTVNCRSGFHVDSDAFDVNDQTRAYPSLASKTLLFAKGSKLPTGVQFETIGNQNLFYSVTGQAVCCPD
jgi:hypothetical protein